VSQQCGAQLLGQRRLETAKPFLDILPYRPVEISDVPENGLFRVRREVGFVPGFRACRWGRNRVTALADMPKENLPSQARPIRLSFYFKGLVRSGQAYRNLHQIRSCLTNEVDQGTRPACVDRQDVRSISRGTSRPSLESLSKYCESSALIWLRVSASSKRRPPTRTEDCCNSHCVPLAITRRFFLKFFQQAVSIDRKQIG